MAQMEKAEKLSITLPLDMLAAIKEKVRTGVYGSTSEAIREAIRLWQREEEVYEARLALIRQRLENAARSGAPVPLDDAFAQIEHLHQKRMAETENENL